jgi:RNA polymerase sigma factor for flagellar operon FliA
VDDFTEANALAVDNMDIVRIIARRMMRIVPASISRDDLEGAGYVGLVQASRKFKPEMGYKFATYAGRRIRGAMLDWLRHMDWVPRLERQRVKAGGGHIPTTIVSLEAKLADVGDGSKDLTRRHILEADQRPPEYEPEEDDFWRSRWACVSPRGWRVLEMYYRDGMTQYEIGALLGVCEARVCQILKAVRLRAAS